MTATNTYLQKGDKIQDFQLLNFDGKTRKLTDYLAKGKLVISFYRGDWCPYCNLEIKTLQENLDKIKSKGANLIAISPQMPDYGLLFKEKHKLNFDVLSDLGNVYAKKNGLEIIVPPQMLEILKEKALLNEKSYQRKGTDFVLPIPATYVIDRTGKVIFSFVDIDFTKRASVQQILSVL